VPLLPEKAFNYLSLEEPLFQEKAFNYLIAFKKYKTSKKHQPLYLSGF
jgi:hypothetical protein